MCPYFVDNQNKINQINCMIRILLLLISLVVSTQLWDQYNLNENKIWAFGKKLISA